MARAAANDRQFLELHRGKWRVSIAVPRDLQPKLGTRLKRPLGTDSLAIANGVKWQVVAELRAEIEQARGRTVDKADPLVREALQLALLRQRARRQEEIDALGDAASARVDAMLGTPIDDDGGEPVYNDAKAARAKLYADISQGKATPIAIHHDQFITEAGNKARTEGDDRRAIKYLLQWCERERISPVMQAIARKTAIRFRDGLPKLAGGGQSSVTLNKYLRRLSRYWAWLAGREEVETNVWERVTLPERIAALTGARLDAIVDLRVKDCADGLFIFKPQKSEPKERAVPIHTVLVEIVARRTAGKQPNDDLFPEWPVPKKAGSVRERSFKASNQFTDYRRAVGVDEVITGKRRSLVNFHSFRRWFITKAEQADQPESIIAAVVGHKRQGMTLGRYSAGPLIDQARRCVEAVRLPG